MASPEGRRCPDEAGWVATLPRLCEPLCAAGAAGPLAARLLLQDRWRWLERAIAERRAAAPPSLRRQALASLARPILGWLEAAGQAAHDPHAEAVPLLCTAENEPVLPCLIEVLRAASAHAVRAVPGLEAIARHCVQALSARLSRPARDPSDWSIALPRDCAAAL